MKTLLELSKIDCTGYFVELKNGSLERLSKVIIIGKNAYVLLENGRWALFFSDESIEVAINK